MNTINIEKITNLGARNIYFIEYLHKYTSLEEAWNNSRLSNWKIWYILSIYKDNINRDLITDILGIFSDCLNQTAEKLEDTSEDSQEEILAIIEDYILGEVINIDNLKDLVKTCRTNHKVIGVNVKVCAANLVSCYLGEVLIKFSEGILDNSDILTTMKLVGYTFYPNLEIGKEYVSNKIREYFKFREIL